MSYFKQWYEDICNKLQHNGKLKELEVEFNQETCDLGRMSILSKHKSLGNHIYKCYNAKCNKKSEQHRTIGNKYYSRKEHNKAILSYSHSISYGNEGSRELSLAYANRSVVLFLLKEFKLAENDINTAFEKGYPMNMHYKLYERLGRCYLQCGNTKLASEAFKNGLSCLDDSNLDDNKKDEFARTFFKLSSKCDGSIMDENDFKSTIKNYLYKTVPPSIPNYDLNEIYPCASKAFSIVDNDDEGRHAIATRDIPIGEIIIVEKPFTAICFSGYFETHCYNCLQSFKVCYPCRNCASVRYCSLECENKCWTSFHRYECEYFNLLVHDIGLGHLALKMIVQVGVEGLSEFTRRAKIIKESGNERLGTNENGIYEPSDYYCLYSLVGNSNLRKLSDLFRRSLIAQYLCNILCQTGFIKEGADMDNDYCNVGSHLLKQIQMLPCNAHEVSELQLTGDDIANSELKEIGSAAYTTLSLLNHSCDPSVVRHSFGDVCVLRAVKYIKKGGPIVDNYGHLYPVEVKADRQKQLLDQYYFDCKCVPCVEDWPLYNDLSQGEPKFKCDQCDHFLDNESPTCSNCKHIHPDINGFAMLRSDHHKCMEHVLNTGEYEKDLPKLLEYANLVSRKSQLPVVHFNNCQEIVKLCFGLQGNCIKLNF